jgi:hypothetical protein
MLAMFSLSVLAKKQYERQPYGENIFCWMADVPENPTSNSVITSQINFVGSGGIKVTATRLANNRYEVVVDGSSISSAGGIAAGASGGTMGPVTGASAVRVGGDFSAATNSIYFVEKTATCTLPSAVGAIGKEILVWNARPSGVVVTYKTTQNQTISGAASGSAINSTAFKIDRFMSDGGDWYRE